MPKEIAEFIKKRNGECVRYIFRASITIKGVKYYARDYGIKAFRIPL